MAESAVAKVPKSNFGIETADFCQFFNVMRGSKYLLIIAPVIAIALGALTAHVVNARRGSDYYVRSLQEIQTAKERWAGDNFRNGNSIPTWNELLPYLNSDFKNFYWTNGFVVRPQGGMYVIGRVGDRPVCLVNGRTIYP